MLKNAIDYIGSNCCNVTTDRALLFCSWHFWNRLVVTARLVVKIIDLCVTTLQLLAQAYISTVSLPTDPLASGQRKRLLGSDKKISKRPKTDVTVQGMICHCI